MRRNGMSLLFALLAFSMVAVVAAQYYWIDNTLEQKEQNFNSMAIAVMEKTARELETASTCFEVFNKVDLDGRQSLLVLQANAKENGFQVTDTIKQFMKTTPNDTFYGYPYINTRAALTAEVLVRYHYIPDTINNPRSDNEANQLPNLTKSQVKEYFRPNQAITYAGGDSSYTAFVDSLLRMHFASSNIFTPFSFAVKMEPGSKYVFRSKNFDTSGSQTALSVPLYNESYFFAPHQLVVQFPGKGNYLLGQMWFVLVGSVLIILGLIATCYFAVRTILRQKKLSEMKTDFINNMTHEFKTPIANISLALETIATSNGHLDRKGLDNYLRIISSENERLDSNVERILQLSMMERDEKMRLRLSEVDVHELIEEVSRNFEVQLLSAGGCIIHDFEATDPILTADKAQLSSIFYNLIDNAIKYNHATPVIRIETWNVGVDFEISITDNGIGIPREEQERIFDRFYRVPTGNLHDVKGFGLGLAYVHSIVEAHHGSIHLRSEPGKGSTFTIHIPQKHETYGSKSKHFVG